MGLHFNRYRWRWISGGCFILVLATCMVAPRILTGRAIDLLRDSKIGDPEFVRGLELLSIADAFPFWDRAEDAAAHYASVKMGALYVDCSDLRYAVTNRLRHAYFDTLERELRSGDKGSARSEMPDFNAKWMDHATDAERNDLCSRLAAGIAWLRNAGTNVDEVCPCAQTP